MSQDSRVWIYCPKGYQGATSHPMCLVIRLRLSLRISHLRKPDVKVLDCRGSAVTPIYNIPNIKHYLINFCYLFTEYSPSIAPLEDERTGINNARFLFDNPIKSFFTLIWYQQTDAMAATASWNIPLSISDTQNHKVIGVSNHLTCRGNYKKRTILNKRCVLNSL